MAALERCELIPAGWRISREPSHDGAFAGLHCYFDPRIERVYVLPVPHPEFVERYANETSPPALAQGDFFSQVDSTVKGDRA